MKKFERIMCGVLTAGMIVCGFSSCEKSGAANENYSYNLSKYIQLPQYKGLEANLTGYILTEDRMEAEIKSSLYYYAKTVEILDRGAETGDTVSVSYEGYADGVLVDSGADRQVTLGTGMLPSGMEEALVGCMAGYSVSMAVTYPESYAELPECAGKTVEYTAVLNGIYEVKLPKYTDDFVKGYFGYDTVEDYENAVRTGLEEYYEELNTEYVISQIWPQIVDNTVVLQYPEKELQAYYDEFMAPHQRILDNFDITLENYASVYYSMTADEFTESVMKEAEDAVKTEMIGYAIARAENITVTDEEYTERAEAYAAEFEMESLEEFEETYGKDKILQLILIDKVREFTAANAKAAD